MTLTSGCPAPGTLLSHLLEFGIDDLLSFLEHSYQVGRFASVAGCEECVRSACTIGTACSSDTVYIILGVRWVVKVYNKLYIFYVCKMEWLLMRQWSTMLRRPTVFPNPLQIYSTTTISKITQCSLQRIRCTAEQNLINLTR